MSTDPNKLPCKLPGENGLHNRDGSLLKKKREQWEKEKAENSTWFPFGTDDTRSSSSRSKPDTPTRTFSNVEIGASPRSANVDEPIALSANSFYSNFGVGGYEPFENISSSFYQDPQQQQRQLQNLSGAVVANFPNYSLPQLQVQANSLGSAAMTPMPMSAAAAFVSYTPVPAMNQIPASFPFMPASTPFIQPISPLGFMPHSFTPNGQQPTQQNSNREQRFQTPTIEEQLEERRRLDALLAEEERRERERVERARQQQEQRRAQEEAEKAEKQRHIQEFIETHERIYQQEIEKARLEAEVLKKARLYKHVVLDAAADSATVRRLLGTDDAALLQRVLKQLNDLERQKRIDLENMSVYQHNTPGSSAKDKDTSISTGSSGVGPTKFASRRTTLASKENAAAAADVKKSPLLTRGGLGRASLRTPPSSSSLSGRQRRTLAGRSGSADRSQQQQQEPGNLSSAEFASQQFDAFSAFTIADSSASSKTIMPKTDHTSSINKATTTEPINDALGNKSFSKNVSSASESKAADLPDNFAPSKMPPPLPPKPLPRRRFGERSALAESLANDALSSVVKTRSYSTTSTTSFSDYATTKTTKDIDDCNDDNNGNTNESALSGGTANRINDDDAIGGTSSIRMSMSTTSVNSSGTVVVQNSPFMAQLPRVGDELQQQQQQQQQQLTPEMLNTPEISTTGLLSHNVSFNDADSDNSNVASTTISTRTTLRTMPSSTTGARMSAGGVDNDAGDNNNINELFTTPNRFQHQRNNTSSRIDSENEKTPTNSPDKHESLLLSRRVDAGIQCHVDNGVFAFEQIFARRSAFAQGASASVAKPYEAIVARFTPIIHAKSPTKSAPTTFHAKTVRCLLDLDDSSTSTSAGRSTSASSSEDSAASMATDDSLTTVRTTRSSTDCTITSGILGALRANGQMRHYYDEKLKSAHRAASVTPSMTNGATTTTAAVNRPPSAAISSSSFTAKLAENRSRQDKLIEQPKLMRRNLESPTMKHLQESLGNLSYAGDDTSANRIIGNNIETKEDTAQSRPITPKPFHCRSEQYPSLNLKRDMRQGGSRHNAILDRLASVRGQLKQRQIVMENTLSCSRNASINTNANSNARE